MFPDDYHDDNIEYSLYFLIKLIVITEGYMWGEYNQVHKFPTIYIYFLWGYLE